MLARQVCAEQAGRQVLHQVDLVLDRGVWLALVGPNGAGKSTLLQCLAGLQPITLGHVVLKGRQLEQWGAQERARHLSWLSQHGLSGEGLTVRDTVALGRMPYQGWMGLASASRDDERAVDQALRDTGLEGLAARRLEALSGGERQRVWLARALSVQADVLLLDEPATYLDVPHQRLLTQVLRREAEQGRAVVSTVHDLSLALLADRVAVMDQGRIVALGSRDDAVVHRAIEQVFRQAISIQPVQERWVAVPQI